jgi:hypothetical protein
MPWSVMFNSNGSSPRPSVFGLSDALCKTISPCFRGAASALRKLRNAAQRQENESCHMIDADNERDEREAQNRVALLAINL